MINIKSLPFPVEIILGDGEVELGTFSVSNKKFRGVYLLPTDEKHEVGEKVLDDVFRLETPEEGIFIKCKNKKSLQVLKNIIQIALEEWENENI